MRILDIMFGNAEELMRYVIKSKEKVMKIAGTLFGALALLVVAQAAVADDINPPPWRGEISTTSQYWEFLTPDDGQPNGLQPDGSPPGGQPWLPSTKLWVTPGPGMDWIDVDPLSGRQGIWPLSGEIEVVVDNHDPNPQNIKLIWVQITWRPQDVCDVPLFTGLDPQPVAPPELIGEIPLGDCWTHSTYYWELDWNPPDEWFTIYGNIDVDELVIDTWCVPEPATLSLLGLGVLAFARRRRS